MPKHYCKQATTNDHLFVAFLFTVAGIILFLWVAVWSLLILISPIGWHVPLFD